MRELEYIIDKDIIIKEYIKNNISKKFYRYLKRVGYTIYLNGNIVKNYNVAHTSDILKIAYEEESTNDTNYYEKELDIVYECDDFFVLYKPKGLKSIPTGYNDFKSLYNMILYYYKCKGIKGTVHFINRLDKDTEGLLIVAKNKITANKLSNNLDSIKREYLAIVEGIIENDISIDIGIKQGEGIKREASIDGKDSFTYCHPLKYKNNTTLVQLRLESGRCHQIRVHMKYVGHPILGDPLYGTGDDLHLCSYRIKFINPVDNTNMEFMRYPEWRNIFEEG